MINKILLFLITLITFTNISYASFPVIETEQSELTITNLASMDPWYISLKNAILFLFFSFFGIMVTSVIIYEGFFAEDGEVPIGGVIAGILIGIGGLFASLFYAKKVWKDKLSQKIIIGIISLIAMISLVTILIYGGGVGGG